MKVVDTRGPFLARIIDDSVASGMDTVKDVEARQVKRTGNLAAGTDLSVEADPRKGVRMRVFNRVVYAWAVEAGANTREKASVKKGTKRSRSKKHGDMVGPLRERKATRGPHMAGNHVVRDTAGVSFVAHMDRRVRS